MLAEEVVFEQGRDRKMGIGRYLTHGLPVKAM
jgi:hypothetical protein